MTGQKQRLFNHERMLAFSDGVFAVAITLLVLDLRLPELAADTSSDVLAALLAMWPKILIFGFTFIVVGMCWLEHHRKFSLLHQIDDRLLWLNLIYLMVLCLVPFGTNVFSEHHNHFAFAFYTLIMTLLMLVSTLSSAYALRPPFLTEAGVHPHVRQDMIFSPLNWRQTEIPASPQIFYQVYGVVGSNGVNDDLGGDKNSFLFAAARGEISAEVTSTIDRSYRVPDAQ